MIRSEKLELLYNRLNRRKYIHPDPLEFLYRYDSLPDREIAALVGSALAYGRVERILSSTEKVLGILGVEPAKKLRNFSFSRLKRELQGFRHRFNSGTEVASLLAGAGRIIKSAGSLGVFFAEGLASRDGTVLPAVCSFVKRLRKEIPVDCGHLLPDPAKGSACKRLNLMLRWLVRRDEVDPGGWEHVGAGRLIVPLDTHMHRIGILIGATEKKQAGMATALEITDAFRALNPGDPVKYDFALTRLGIRNDMHPDELQLLAIEITETIGS